MSDTDLLNEELKRHMLIVEYTFEEGLIPEEEEEESDGDFDFDDTEAPEEDGDKDGDEGGELGFDDKDIDLGDDSGEDFDFGGESEAEEPAEDEVEVDITQLIGDIEQNKNVANNANTKMDNLIQQFGQLQQSLKSMDSISQKITDMEADLDKRMPTEEDKLEMRSLDSYPYNIKLTDYWSDQKGKYDVMDTDVDIDKEEYVLTQDDIDNEYNDKEAMDSFNPYEEDTVTY